MFKTCQDLVTRKQIAVTGMNNPRMGVCWGLNHPRLVSFIGASQAQLLKRAASTRFLLGKSWENITDKCWPAADKLKVLATAQHLHHHRVVSLVVSKALTETHCVYMRLHMFTHFQTSVSTSVHSVQFYILGGRSNTARSPAICRFGSSWNDRAHWIPLAQHGGYRIWFQIWGQKKSGGIMRYLLVLIHGPWT
jgi:hypothetical protein